MIVHLMNFVVIWFELVTLLRLWCTGPGVQPDSGDRHTEGLDHVQSQYRSSHQSGPSGWNETSRSACHFLPSNLLHRKLCHSRWHPRSAPGHLHQTAQMEEGTSPIVPLFYDFHEEPKSSPFIETFNTDVAYFSWPLYHMNLPVWCQTRENLVVLSFHQRRGPKMIIISSLFPHF